MTSSCDKARKEIYKRIFNSMRMTKMPATDNIKNPKHYSTWKIEPIQFIVENEIPYAEGNIIKYVMRWKYKNGLEDLHKAKEYLDILIKDEMKKGEPSNVRR